MTKSEGEIKETEEKAEKDENLVVYEVGYHLLPTVEEDKLDSEVKKIKKAIEGRGGVLISDEAPKKIDLSYTIKKGTHGKRDKYDDAYFGWIKFEMNKEMTNELEEELKSSTNILRFLLIKTVRENIAIQSVMQSRVVPVRGTISKPLEKPVSTIAKPEGDKPLISEEELDRTIEELVVE